jgi:hypothetical protein
VLAVGIARTTQLRLAARRQTKQEPPDAPAVSAES